MAKKVVKGRTHFAFTAPSRKAAAIAVTAARYPDKEISAEVMPIGSADEAKMAFGRAIKPVETTGAAGLDRNLNDVRERYLRLGEAGTSSLVELNVPVGGQKFDFQTFYEQVDDLLALEAS